MAKRFEITYQQGALETFKVIRDNETGVQYLVNHTGAGGGITVLIDKDGKPLLDESAK